MSPKKTAATEKRSIIEMLKQTRAFTMAETLVAVLILLLVTLIVAAGLPTAVNAYHNIVMVSNAEVLLSTTMSTLRNELYTAGDISISDNGKSITYYNESDQSMSKIFMQDKDIMFIRYATDDIILKDSELAEGVKENYDQAQKLVSGEASDKDKELHVSFAEVSYDDDIVTFSGLVVSNRDGSRVITERGGNDDYSIRVITDE